MMPGTSRHAVVRGMPPLFGALVALWVLLLQPQAATAAAQFIVSPTRGSAGSMVAASGDGFQVGETVSVRWGGITGLVLVRAATTPRGTFVADFAVPLAAANGAYDVWAIGDTSIAYATASFTVTGGDSRGSDPTDATSPILGRVPAPSSSDDLTPGAFDLTGFPHQATSFEEQLIEDSLRDPNTLINTALQAFAHRQLGRYYASHGRVDLAAGEFARAVAADPVDARSYQGLAALNESLGAPVGDGVVDLRDVAKRLRTTDELSTLLLEPEPVVMPDPDPGRWQETTAEFNRRMNSVYTSPMWNSLYRTVFPNLYGR